MHSSKNDPPIDGDNPPWNNFVYLAQSDTGVMAPRIQTNDFRIVVPFIYLSTIRLGSLATLKLDPGRVGEPGTVDDEECGKGLDDLLSTR